MFHSKGNGNWFFCFFSGGRARDTITVSVDWTAIRPVPRVHQQFGGAGVSKIVLYRSVTTCGLGGVR